jgi:hypothetical protein
LKAYWISKSWTHKAGLPIVDLTGSEPSLAEPDDHLLIFLQPVNPANIPTFNLRQASPNLHNCRVFNSNANNQQQAITR